MHQAFAVNRAVRHIGTPPEAHKNKAGELNPRDASPAHTPAPKKYPPLESLPAPPKRREKAGGRPTRAHSEPAVSF